MPIDIINDPRLTPTTARFLAVCIEEDKKELLALKAKLKERDEILECFQHGDSAALESLARELKEENWKRWEDEIEVLERMAEAARKMEANP